MRPLFRLLPALLAAAPAFAQGVVNESLLRAPNGGAAKTWSSRTFEQVQGSIVYVAVEVDGNRGAFVVERASFTGIETREEGGI